MTNSVISKFFTENCNICKKSFKLLVDFRSSLSRVVKNHLFFLRLTLIFASVLALSFNLQLLYIIFLVFISEIGLAFYSHKNLKLSVFFSFTIISGCFLILAIFKFFFNFGDFLNLLNNLSSTLGSKYSLIDCLLNTVYTFLVTSNFNNFLTQFSYIYPTQACPALEHFDVISIDCISDNIVLKVNREAFLFVDWSNITFIMDSDSNPIFFSMYNFNFFRHEFLSFCFSIIILLISILFFSAFTPTNKFSNQNDYDVLYRLTEVMLIGLLINVNFSSSYNYIDSIQTFGYSFVFNNLFVVTSSVFIIKNCLIFIFLFLIFFFRFRSFLLYTENNKLKAVPDTFQNINFSLSPPETSFLLLNLLTFSLLMLVSNDYSVLLICLESLTFITAIIIALDSNQASTSAALKYFTLGVGSSGLLALASSLTYGLLLSLDLKNITDFFLFSTSVPTEFLPVLGFTSILVFLSFLTKLSIFPGNFWVLDIYSSCSLPVLSLLILLKPIYFFAFAKLFFSLYVHCYDYLSAIIITASIGSMCFSAYGLLTEQSIKQFVAYSSTGQFGFLLLSFVCYNDYITASAIILYLFYYTTAMLIFFFSIMQLTLLKSLDKFTDIQSTGGCNIILFFLAISLMSLAGLPPFLGFFAKINILINLVTSGFSDTFLIIVFLLNVAMTFGYIRVIRIIYFTLKKSKVDTDLVLLSGRTEFNNYINNLINNLIESNLFFKISYYFYFCIVSFLVCLHISGLYFFGFILELINSNLTILF